MYIFGGSKGSFDYCFSPQLPHPSPLDRPFCIAWAACQPASLPENHLASQLHRSDISMSFQQPVSSLLEQIHLKSNVQGERLVPSGNTSWCVPLVTHRLFLCVQGLTKLYWIRFWEAVRDSVGLRAFVTNKMFHQNSIPFLRVKFVVRSRLGGRNSLGVLGIPTHWKTNII